MMRVKHARKWNEHNFEDLPQLSLSKRTKITNYLTYNWGFVCNFCSYRKNWDFSATAKCAKTDANLRADILITHLDSFIMHLRPRTRILDVYKCIDLSRFLDSCLCSNSHMNKVL